MHLLLQKEYLDATASRGRAEHRDPPGPRRGRPPSPPRRWAATVLARAARAVDGETARRAVT